MQLSAYNESLSCNRGKGLPGVLKVAVACKAFEHEHATHIHPLRQRFSITLRLASTKPPHHVQDHTRPEVCSDATSSSSSSSTYASGSLRSSSCTWGSTRGRGRAERSNVFRIGAQAPCSASWGAVPWSVAGQCWPQAQHLHCLTIPCRHSAHLIELSHSVLWHLYQVELSFQALVKVTQVTPMWLIQRMFVALCKSHHACPSPAACSTR